MSKVKPLFFLLLILPFLLPAQPIGYYDAAAGKTGEILRASLRDIITAGHVKIPYTSTAFDIWNAYAVTDVRPAPNNTIIWDMYSDIPGGTPAYTFTIYTQQCGTASKEGDCYSREHSMPNSWWGGLDNAANPQYSDLHLLFPADQYVNNKKSNYIIAQTISPTWTSTNGSRIGPCSLSGFTGTIFEPINEYKGDFARAYLYIATRYMNYISTWVTTYPSYDSKYIINSAGGNYKQWYIDMLLAWSASDPVSQKEIDRNNNIYSNTPQHNRNPYVDHPEYINAVWGTTTILPEPTNHVLSFAYSTPTTTTIPLTWNNNDGTQPAEKYLLLINKTGTFSPPIDGTAIVDDLNLADDAGAVNVNHSTQAYTWASLSPGTIYYFRIYPYTNSGTAINYKTDGSIPSLTTTTLILSTPTLAVAPSSLTGFSYISGNGPSGVQSFIVSGNNLTNDISLFSPTNFEISKTAGTGFVQSLLLTQSSGVVNSTLIYVRLKAGLAVGNYNSETIAIAATGASQQNVSCSGSVTTSEPANHVTLFAAATVIPSTSAIDASWLDATGSIVPTGYVIKAATGSYSNIDAPVDGLAETAGLLVKLVAPGTRVAHFTGLSSGTQYFFKCFPCTGNDATLNYKTDGTVPSATTTTDTPGTPQLTAMPTTLSGFGYVMNNGPSAVQSFTVSGNNLTSGISLSSIANFEISKTAGTGFVQSLSLTQSSGVVNSTLIYVRLKAGLAVGNYNSETIAIASTGASQQTVSCSGSVTTSEPANHVTLFAAATVIPSTSAIDASWLDATGSIVPTGYVIKAATGSYSNINAPMDGLAETAGQLVKLVVPGAQVAHFTGLNPGTQYYFSIFPYTGAGTAINYKTAQPPQATATTEFEPVTASVFISEYLEGTGYNKAIEITNAGASPVDLSKLSVKLYSNGNISPASIWTGSTGMLGAGGSYILYNKDASSAIRLVGSEASGVTYFSGNDALELLYENQITDVFGNIGTDPGTAWSVAGIPEATANHSLVRKLNILQGTSNWLSSAGTDALSSQWVVKNTDMIGNLGAFGSGWEGATSNDWGTASNWDQGIPSASVNAIISKVANEPIISAAATVKNLLLQPGASLLGNEKLTVAGTCEVMHAINAFLGGSVGWQLLSSPVASQPMAPVFTDAYVANYDLFKWSEPGNAWLSQKDAINSISGFIPGAGYLAAYANANVKKFSGHMNSANIPVTGLTKTSTSRPAWHLLGNPFVSAIRWNDGNWALTNIANTAKIWNETSASYTDVQPATGIIPAMHGFMVETSGSGSLIIPAVSRFHDSDLMKKADSNERIRLVARDLSTGTSQESIIKVNADATAGFDSDFDSHFLAGFAPKFYSIVGSEQLSTNTLPVINKNTWIDLGFAKTASGKYSILISENSFVSLPSLFLTDKVTGTVTDLSKTPAYNFTSYESDMAKRFTLSFADITAIKPAYISEFQVYTYRNILFIKQSEPQKGSVFIYNSLGQLLSKFSLENTSRQEIDLQKFTSGVYMVSIRTEKRLINQKVVVGD